MRVDRKKRIYKIYRIIVDFVGPSDDFGYHRIHSSKFLEETPEYKQDLQYLEGNGYIEVDHFYKNGAKSKGYKLTNRHLGIDFGFVPKETSESSGSLGRRQKKQQKKNQFGETHLVNEALSKFSIIPELVTDEIREHPHLTKWRTHDLSPPKRSKHRLFTTLTSTKKDVRRCLGVDGKQAVEMDIKSCQPFLVGVLANDAKLIETIRRSDIYDFLFPHYKSRDSQRKAWGMLQNHEKRDQVPQLRKPIQVMKTHFPRAYEWMLTTNQPWMPLFKAEADLMIERVLFPLLNQGLAVGSIHDAIVCCHVHEQYVRNWIINESKELYGSPVCLEVKNSCAQEPWL